MQRPGSASPTPCRSEGAGNGSSSMSVLGSVPTGELQTLDKGVHRCCARQWDPRRLGGGGGQRTHRGPQAPGEVAQEAPAVGHAQVSVAPVPSAARVGRDPAPGESGRPPLRGARAAPNPRAEACKGGPAGKMSPVCVRSFARGSAVGQRRPKLPGPAHERAPTARQLPDRLAGFGRRRSPARGNRAMPCEQPNCAQGSSPANLVL